MRTLVAEFIGTFALIFTGTGAIITDAYTGGGVDLVGVALAHGVVLSLMISAGHISGGVFNPAVAVGLWLARKLDAAKMVSYIIAQLLGGAAAGFLLKVLMPATAVATAKLGTPLLASGIGF